MGKTKERNNIVLLFFILSFPPLAQESNPMNSEVFKTPSNLVPSLPEYMTNPQINSEMILTICLRTHSIIKDLSVEMEGKKEEKKWTRGKGV